MWGWGCTKWWGWGCTKSWGCTKPDMFLDSSGVADLLRSRLPDQTVGACRVGSPAAWYQMVLPWLVRRMYQAHSKPLSHLVDQRRNLPAGALVSLA